MKFLAYWNVYSIFTEASADDHVADSANHLVALMRDIQEHPEDFDDIPARVSRGADDRRVMAVAAVEHALADRKVAFRNEIHRIEGEVNKQGGGVASLS